jgi:hypothetical protein
MIISHIDQQNIKWLEMESSKDRSAFNSRIGVL